VGILHDNMMAKNVISNRLAFLIVLSRLWACIANYTKWITGSGYDRGARYFSGDAYRHETQRERSKCKKSRFQLE
jgi:hypothetical protein